MGTAADMVESELRNEAGYPPMLNLEAGAGLTVGRDAQQNRVSGASVLMVDSTRLLPLVMLSCFLSGGALFAVIMVAWLLPGSIEANARADLAKDVAMAQAEARMAGTDAAIAKNTVQKLEIRINGQR